MWERQLFNFVWTKTWCKTGASRKPCSHDNQVNSQTEFSSSTNSKLMTGDRCVFNFSGVAWTKWTFDELSEWKQRSQISPLHGGRSLRSSSLSGSDLCITTTQIKAELTYAKEMSGNLTPWETFFIVSKYQLKRQMFERWHGRVVLFFQKCLLRRLSQCLTNRIFSDLNYELYLSYSRSYFY